jgi:hypothetical protein
MPQLVDRNLGLRRRRSRSPIREHRIHVCGFDLPKDGVELIDASAEAGPVRGGNLGR